MVTTVVNIYHNYDDSLPSQYIGRSKSGMHYGNPFSHYDNSLASFVVPTRQDAVRAFDDWLHGEYYTIYTTGQSIYFGEIEIERRDWILAHLEDLRDKQLKCFCHPQACHGDVYIKLLKERSHG